MILLTVCLCSWTDLSQSLKTKILLQSYLMTKVKAMQQISMRKYYFYIRIKLQILYTGITESLQDNSM